MMNGGLKISRRITQTLITNAATGITLSVTTGLTITKVDTSTFTLTTGGTNGGAGVLLSAAQSLWIQYATISNNVIGLVATGDCKSSQVLDTTWISNTTGVVNTSTGIPPLDINPLP